jgi:hypothetical protein
MMAPVFERAAAELELHVRLVKVDTEGAPDLAAHFNIRSVPSLVLVQHGKEIARSAGVTATLAAELPGVTMRMPEATYLAWLDCRALELSCPAGAVLSRSGQGWAEFWGDLWCGLRGVRAAEFRRRRRRY